MHVREFAPQLAQRGNTPLMLAAQNGHTECVRLLEDAGANKEAKNSVRVPLLRPCDVHIVDTLSFSELCKLCFFCHFFLFNCLLDIHRQGLRLVLLLHFDSMAAWPDCV